MSDSRTELCLTSDAAQILGRSTRQITRMVHAGQIKPAFKAPGLRGAYLFRRTEIEQLAKETAK